MARPDTPEIHRRISQRVEDRHELPRAGMKTPELLILNKIVSDLVKIHNLQIRLHNQKNRLDLERYSQRLHEVHIRISEERGGPLAAELQQEYDDIRRDLQHAVEVKDVARHERIRSYYETHTGKIHPATYTAVKERHKDRLVSELEHEGRTITTDPEIVSIMQKWYENTAQAETPQEATLSSFLDDHGTVLPQLTPAQQDDMAEEITQAEVLWAINEAAETSAPGPTGQTIALYKLIFHELPNILTNAVNQMVFVPGLLDLAELRWIQDRKVVWIPKKPSPRTPSEYRPLSMLEVLYKIPSRVMSRRLNAILPTIISRNQHGFIQGKGIQEPSITVTHVIQEAQAHNRPLQLASFDIEKAFDRVNHPVIKQSLRAFGVPELVTEGIGRLALTGRFKVEVNGQQGDRKAVRTGSGQGDPLSSVLFNIATEPLNRTISQVTRHLTYRTLEGREIGPIIYADDNINPLCLDNAEQIQEIIRIYDHYQAVSGLNVNISKTSILCINSPEEMKESLRNQGFQTPDEMKHLGIILTPTMEGTIQRTLEAIDVKAIKRRINATTPPTDILHRATLLSTAFTPLYTHVFMALPVEKEQLDALRGEQLSVLWTEQKEGQTVRKRSLVSKKRLHGSHAVGGLNIPNPADIVTGLHQNLIQKL